jgi:hypothetical protein
MTIFTNPIQIIFELILPFRIKNRRSTKYKPNACIAGIL